MKRLADFKRDKEKFRNNIAAINLLNELEFDNRFATSEEREILLRYAGFGGLSDAFDESNEAWTNEFIELYVTLSPEEYAAARESALFGVELDSLTGRISQRLCSLSWTPQCG